MDLGTVFDFGFHFLLVLAMLPVGIGVVWLTRFFRTGQHSLRELFWFVGYWAVTLAIYGAAWPWLVSKP